MSLDYKKNHQIEGKISRESVVKKQLTHLLLMVAVICTASGCNPASPSARQRPTPTVSPALPPGTVLGTFSVGPSPRAIAIDAAGNAWITHDKGLAKLSPQGVSLGTFDGSGHSVIAIDPSGTVWLSGNSPVLQPTEKLLPDGNSLGLCPPPPSEKPVGATTTETVAFTGLAFDASNNAWAVWNTLSTFALPTPDPQTGQSPPEVEFPGRGNVKKVAPNCTVLSNFELVTGTQATGIALDGAGNIWVAISPTHV